MFAATPALSRKRLLLLGGLAVVVALCLGVAAARPLLERAIRERIQTEAARHGLQAQIDTVRVGLWPPIRLTGVTLRTPASWLLNADSMDASWLGGTRLIVRKAVLHGPAGLTVAAASTAWDIAGVTRGDLHAELIEPQTGFVLSRITGARESRWTVRVQELPVGRLLDVRRFGQPLIDSGTIRGSLILRTSAEAVHFELDLAARAARLPALTEDGSKPAALGRPTEVAVTMNGTWKRLEGFLGIPRFSARVEGAALSGSLELRDLDADPLVDLSLEVERVDFARLLRTSGLEVPGTLGEGGNVQDDLGTAKLVAGARGRRSDPASFIVTQKLDFIPPKRLPPAIVRLRGDFVHEVATTSGVHRIDVAPSSPDFIPLGEVPPLFLRALLIAEDAGFYGHPGIDLREMPAALLTNWERGGAARGASTITQQLAKNLFLSHEKHLGRKLQELWLTLLLEAALSKGRILEIYLNVIEWGPGFYGLKPAARTYFGLEPAQLSPAQMAFLVSIIPGPLKYQSSFAHGTPGPGLRKLVNNLLAKLRSVDALSEEEYQRALEDEILVQGRGERSQEPRELVKPE